MNYSKIDEFKTKSNSDFLKLAKDLKPRLYQEKICPDQDYENKVLRKNDSIVIDFKDHFVGYLSFTLETSGSHFDAPAYLKLNFAENEAELDEDSSTYDGWLSKAWIQEEFLHIDIMPQRVDLKRRYAFRYLKITVIDTSEKYGVSFKDICLRAVSSADMNAVKDVNTPDPMLNRIDYIGRKTLQQCMQEVFEDGVKRDRRLWLGDLFLQAKVNYVTFKNYDLVKRCLYMFAGMTFDDDRIGACFFTEPDFAVDDTYLADYAMFFLICVWDYYEATGDRKTLEDLYPIAIKQIDIVLKNNVKGFVYDDIGDSFTAFVDWSKGLNKQASVQAITIYALGYGAKVAEFLGDIDRSIYYKKCKDAMTEAALENFWDQDKKMFVSGKDRQISWASQVWMIEAEVVKGQEAKDLIKRTMEFNPEYKMVSPYMYHHFIVSIIKSGDLELAKNEMKNYWGKMVEAGADTFWELYNPLDPNESPYGSTMVNSYCHAWSCTPTYLIRKYFVG
ncbi:MAG: sugar hydrolase [Pseudobutyrivibrio sp.]|nr:sugar hydrolase [Pseudobutyrivibrio sp.]